MAIAVTSDASRFVRTANLPGRTAHAMWGWFMLTTDRNTFSGVLSIASGTDPANPTYNYIETDAGGLAFELYAGSATSAMFTASLNTWYFIAMVRNGDGANAVTAYWRALGTNTLSSTSATPTGTGSTTFTPGHMAFGGTAYTGEFMSGRMHAVGAADAVLSADELLALSFFHEPQLKGIRSLNVFYPTIESVNSNATVDRSGNGRNATSTVGALADSPSLLWMPQPIVVVPAIAGGDVQAALTGSGITGAAGTVTPTLSKALVGEAATSAHGNVAPSLSIALSGQAITSAAGTLAPALSLALAGEAATFAQGDVTASLGGDVTAALNGQASTIASGSVGVTADKALTGTAQTLEQGALTPSAAVQVSGASASGATGAVSPALSLALSGVSGAFSQGNVTPVVGVTIELVGEGASFGQGTLTADLSPLLAGETLTLSQGTLAVQGTGPSPVGPSPGGGGRIWYQGKRGKRPELNRQIDEILDSVAAEILYRDIAASAPESIKEQAAKVVRPHSEQKRAALPAVESIDWAAIERDANRVRRLLTLWQQMERRREMEREDEEWFFLN